MATGFFENIKVIYDYSILLCAALCGLGYIIILVKKILEFGFIIIKDKIRIMLVGVFLHAIIHAIVSTIIILNT